jgi:hypothetical protein
MSISKIIIQVPKLTRLELLEQNRVELLQLHTDAQQLNKDSADLRIEELACSQLHHIAMATNRLQVLYQQFREYENLNDEYQTLHHEIKGNLAEYYQLSIIIMAQPQLDFLAEKIQLKRELEDLSIEHHALQAEAQTFIEGIEYSQIEEMYYTKEYNTILEEIGTCPTCHQPIMKGV